MQKGNKMKGLLIQAVFLSTFFGGLSSSSLASEDDKPLRFRCVNIFLDAIDCLCGYCEDGIRNEYLFEYDWKKDGSLFTTPIPMQQVKFQLWMSIENEDNNGFDNRSAVVEILAKKFIKSEDLAKLKKIPQDDLEYYIKYSKTTRQDNLVSNEEYKYYEENDSPYYSFETEDTYEVALILVLNDMLSIEGLEEKIFKFINGNPSDS